MSTPTKFLYWEILRIIWQLYLWVSPPLALVPVPDTIKGSTASISNDIWKGLCYLGSKYYIACLITYPIPNLSMWSMEKHLTFFYFNDAH